jgi:hypothetical protein
MISDNLCGVGKRAELGSPLSLCVDIECEPSYELYSKEAAVLSLIVA